jgi:hypothetical protein
MSANSLRTIAWARRRRLPAIRPATTERDQLADFERTDAAREAEHDREAGRR